MLSDTLTENLEQYRIGEKINRLRREKGLGLTQLGAHTGLSAGMLSRLERGQAVPTLPTLMRIALVFGVGLDHFFADPAQAPVCAVVPKSDRIAMRVEIGEKLSHLFESLDYPVRNAPLSAYTAEFPPGGPASAPHRHPGMELLFVLEGRLGLTVHGRRHTLGPEDAMCFEADHDHFYENLGEIPARVIVVVAK
ncbi:MAG: XRE family transcriptional regulator [Rhodobacteraceae bacterium]|nr:MAG: XRE family transcriptional regulator [Paracoccaceae bacterium]